MKDALKYMMCRYSHAAHVNTCNTCNLWMCNLLPNPPAKYSIDKCHCLEFGSKLNKND